MQFTKEHSVSRPQLSGRNSIPAFKINTRLPKCKFLSMTIFFKVTAYICNRENKGKRSNLFEKIVILFWGRDVTKNQCSSAI
jgi:hypothetical protein